MALKWRYPWVIIRVRLRILNQRGALLGCPVVFGPYVQRPRAVLPVSFFDRSECRPYLHPLSNYLITRTIPSTNLKIYFIVH